MSVRKIDAELIYYFIRRLQEQGISCQPWIDQAGLTDVLAKQQKWIPLTAWDQFVALCSQAPLPRPFSLMAASWIIDFDALNQLGGDQRKAAFIYLLNSASTLADLLAQIDRFHGLLTLPTCPALEQDESYVTVYDGCVERYQLSATTCELIFATWLLYIKTFWADKYQMLDHVSVQFRHHVPPHIDDYYPVFGRQLAFGCQRNEIRFPAGLIDLRFIESDQMLYQLMIQSIEKVFAEQRQAIEEADSIHAKCAALIRERLSDEVLSIEQLAEHFHMSASTLRRRLRDEGYSYRVLVDEVRQKLVLEYARQPTVLLNELVKVLGFYDYSAMNKAFQRWFGVSPVEFFRRD